MEIISMRWDRALVISSHTDDAEISMGGTISKLLDHDVEIFHYVLSSAEEEIIKLGYDIDKLKEESKEANKVLGIENYSIWDGVKVNYFNKKRQELADYLYSLKKDISPDVAFVNSSYDTHQDHQVTHNEAVRIFKDIGVLGYEFPYNNLKFSYDLIIGLDQIHVDKKMKAMECFRSQKDIRSYFKPTIVYGTLQANAARINLRSPYAEAFEVVRLTWV